MVRTVGSEGTVRWRQGTRGSAHRGGGWGNARRGVGKRAGGGGIRNRERRGQTDGPGRGAPYHHVVVDVRLRAGEEARGSGEGGSGSGSAERGGAKPAR